MARTVLTVALSVGELVGELGTTSMMAVPDRRQAAPAGAMAVSTPWIVPEPGGQGRRIGAVGDEHLDRGEHTDREPCVLEGDQSLFGRPGAGERGGSDLTDPQTEGHPEEDPEHGQSDNDGEDAVTDDPFGPRRPRSARPEGRAVAISPGVSATAVEAGSPRGQQHREQGEGSDDGDEGDEQAAVAEAAHEREGHHDEGEETDCDRHGAEEDRPPGGGHGQDDRLIVGPSPVAFLAPAGDDEQRVVDGHTEADQSDEILDQLAYPGDRRQGAEKQKGAKDGHGSHEEREPRPRRTRRREPRQQGRRWRR